MGPIMRRKERHGIEDRVHHVLLRQIRNDQQLVLPDIQRDFVWSMEQIRLLMDSVMRGIPSGRCCSGRHDFWRYRTASSCDYELGLTFVEDEGRVSLCMVLDGQQRLQSLYLAVYGTYGRKRLYFNVTSGPGRNPILMCLRMALASCTALNSGMRRTATGRNG